MDMEIESLPEKEGSKVEFYKAFLKAQSEFPAIPKNKTGARNIKYADLDDILEIVLPILHKHGICLDQEVTHNSEFMHCVVTKLVHAASGYISKTTSLVPMSEEDFKGKSTFQAYGTGYSYFKRYALGSELGLRFNDDTDGNIPEREEPRFKKPYAPIGKNTGPLTNMFPG